MSKFLFLIPVGIMLGVGGFVAFWCLIVKLLSLTGWQRLAQYHVLHQLPGPRTSLGWALLNGVRYQGVIRTSIQAEGLALESMFLFRIGHPPLLIPWSAIGPVLREKAFWSTFYSTTFRTDNGGSVSFSFSRDQLAEDIEAWRQTVGPLSSGLTHI